VIGESNYLSAALYNALCRKTVAPLMLGPYN
jgi:hypothetical protein